MPLPILSLSVRQYGMARYTPNELKIINRPLTRRTPIVAGDHVDGCDINRRRISQMFVTDQTTTETVWGIYGPDGQKYTLTMLRRDVSRIERLDPATGNITVWA